MSLNHPIEIFIIIIELKVENRAPNCNSNRGQQPVLFWKITKRKQLDWIQFDNKTDLNAV